MFDLTKLKGSNINLYEILDKIPSSDVLELVKTLGEAYSEGQQTQRELVKINAQKEIILTEIDQKYDLYRYIFEQIFNERKSAVDKSFEVIDKGLKENNREITELGLKSLSQIVTSSPFSDLDKLSKLLEDNQTILI